jgi:hypothetical protein
MFRTVLYTKIKQQTGVFQIVVCFLFTQFLLKSLHHIPLARRCNLLHV